MKGHAMLGHGWRLLLEIVGVAIGGLLVIAAIGAWRLSVAPVAAGSVKPYLEQAINDAGLGFTVEVKEAKLGWHRFRPVLELDVHGVKVTGPGGVPIGSFQDATLGISIRGLLFGRLFPTELDLRRPQLVVIRDASDRFSVRAGEEADGGGTDLASLLTNLAAPPNDKDAVGRMRRIHVVDGTVVVDDQLLGIAWSAPDVDIDINRNALEVTARVHVVLALPQRTAQFVGEAHRPYAGGETRFSVQLDDFDASAISPLAKVLAPLSALAIPVGGRIDGALGANGKLLSGDADLKGADGRLILPEYYPEALAIRALGLKMHVPAGERRLVVDRLAVDFGDAKAELTATAGLDGPAMPVDLRANLTDVPLARFDALWPHGVAVGGRDWVTAHMHAGAVKSGTVHVTATARPDDPDPIGDLKVDGAFDYEGLDADYFPPLLPVRNIAGHATFDIGRMDLTIDSGTLGDIAVSQGAIAIAGLDQNDRAIDIGLAIDGPLKTALSVLDTQPLGLVHRLDLDPAGVGGHVAARLTFAFPLVKTLLSDQIRFGGKGKLDGVAIADIVGPRDVTDGALDIAIDNRGMTLSGKAALARVPAAVDWRESFLSSDRVRSRIGFNAALGDADWKSLALDPSGVARLNGKVGVTGQVTIDRAKTTTLDVTADLASAEVSIDLLGIVKPEDQPGTLAASLVFAGGDLKQVSRLDMQSAGAKFSGSASFAADGGLQHLELPKVSASGADYGIVADAEPAPGHAYAISVTGHRFDASGLLAQQQTSGDSGAAGGPKLDLTLSLDHVTTAPGRGLDSLAGTATISKGRLDFADLHAVAGSGPITLTYKPEGDAIALHLAAADAGAALSGLGITVGARGGTLKLDGQTKGGDGPRTTSGTLDMENFRLIRAPIIARLVNALSPTGLMDLLSGQGLAFDTLNADVDYANGKITLRQGRTAGALGISFEGDVGLNDGKLALKGTVVPVDTLNRIIAAIPVIGNIVTGGDRGGFLGVTYSIAGTTGDPQVSVNPLSAFAPGFLRNLFFLGPSEKAPKPDATPAPPPAATDPPAGKP